MELSTKQKGNLTELQCLTAFAELGYNVSIPYGENCKYDFIADINNNLYKVQVKTCKENNGKIEFATRSIGYNSKGSNTHYYDSNNVDFYCTYYQNKCYLIPFNECGTGTKTLRLTIPRNGQRKNICFAEDYGLDKIISSLL